MGVQTPTFLWRLLLELVCRRMKSFAFFLALMAVAVALPAVDDRQGSDLYDYGYGSYGGYGDYGYGSYYGDYDRQGYGYGDYDRQGYGYGDYDRQGYGDYASGDYGSGDYGFG